MRLESIKSQVKLFFTQNIFKAHKVDHQAEESISAATGCISKSLQIHDPFKRGIKEINDWNNQIPDRMYMFPHNGRKGN